MKVRVLKRFLNYQLGPADVPDRDVPRLLAKGLIEVPGGQAEGDAQASSKIVGFPDDLLEPIAARISASLGVERSSEETPLQFLNRFADECDKVAENLDVRLEQAEAERDAAVQERDGLRTELDAVKAAGVGSNVGTLNTAPDAGSTPNVSGNASSTPPAPGDGKADADKSKGKGK